MESDGSAQAVGTSAHAPTTPAAAHGPAPVTPLARVWQRLRALADQIYPPLGVAPEGRFARVAFALVIALAVAFAAFFIADQALLHAAYQTHAEDLGIMDQALWNATRGHGHFFHQTICDVVGDTNCLGDIPRTAIHFEPVLLLVGLIYAVLPSPITLLVIQALVVASGAFPTFWIASRRLHSNLAGIVFAALYLAFPALQSAVASDFHAVTLSAAFVMFALYCMLSRNNLGLWIACALAMTTKEEVPLLILMLGLSIALFQRRWRLGFALAGVAAAYLGLALLVIHLSSPLGHSSTADRYAYLGATPLKAAIFMLTHPFQVLRDDLLTHDRISYLRTLLSPTGYLALLSPWALLIVVPELAINLLSADPLMRTGGSQYNADIVPVVVFAAIQGVVVLGAFASRVAEDVPDATRQRVRRWLRDIGRALPGLPRWAVRALNAPVARIVMAGAVVLALGLGAREARAHGQSPLTWGFHWPRVTAHAALANTLVAMIPADASVSAQTDLVPHLSQRPAIYLFPDHATSADYLLLDVTGNLFPLQNTPDVYVALVRQILGSGAYRVVRAEDGYLLLARQTATGTGVARMPVTGLPPSFYSFVSPSGPPAHALAARFGARAYTHTPLLMLVGYNVYPGANTNLGIAPLTITTYWRVTSPLPPGLAVQLMLFPPGGQPYADSDLPATQWLPLDQWASGALIAVASRSFAPITGAGVLQFGVRVMATTSGGASTLLPSSLAGQGASRGLPRVDAATGAVVFADEQVVP
ncbi:MAG TPA: DUF2079 domain-containing protein [Ktedonobacterales bacterium]|nr:DUF2079 domain-containing protein [Ktedonobacterales bacterium]